MSADNTQTPSAPPNGDDDRGEMATSEATIASFILRFTQEHPSDAQPTTEGWRGVVRHVQSRQQTGFTRMEEALRFIAHYVAIGEEAGGEQAASSDD